MGAPTQAAEAPLFAVCYDMSDDRERRRVDKCLRGYGFRVQKSVFECRLNGAAHKRLSLQLANLAITSGHVRMYRVYAGGNAPVIGQPPADPVDAAFSYAI